MEFNDKNLHNLKTTTMTTLWDKFVAPDNFHLAWDKVASNRGCAGVDRQTIRDVGHHLDRTLSRLRKELHSDNYCPLPLRQIWIPKGKKNWRELRVPTVRDRIVQQALLNILHDILEPQFEVNSYAYRPGRSHLMAVRQVEYLHKRGYEWVLDADILKFFDNVRHARLYDEVSERRVQPKFLDLIERWVGSSLLTRNGLVFPEKGIPQGAVISPILANVYLDDFDELCLEKKVKLVRYADDFVLLSRTSTYLTHIHKWVEQWLTSAGLSLHPDKTHIVSFDRGFKFLGHTFSGDLVLPPTPQSLPQRSPPTVSPNYRLVHSDCGDRSVSELQQAMVAALKQSNQPIPPPLFVALGFAIREPSPVQISSAESAWIPDMANLYLVNQGTKLRKKHRRFIADLDPPVEIPIKDVDSILAFGAIDITPAAITACLNEGIPIFYLSQLGNYKGHLWSGEWRNMRIETAQFEKQSNLEFQLNAARALVWGKVMNSRQLLLRLNRKRKLDTVAEAIRGLSQDIESLETAENIDEVRGCEGAAAARYFPAFGQLIVNQGFSFHYRRRQPPPDPVNALLSFGYVLLFNNVLSFLLAEGVHPYLGNLHRSERNEPHLAFDLMEEFRSPIVDTLVLQLVNKKILKPTDFSWPDEEKGVLLEKTSKRIFLREFEKRMNTATSHPDVNARVSYRRAIQLQVQRYRRSVTDGEPYEAFLRAV